MFLKAIRSLTHFIFPNSCLLCTETVDLPDMLCSACQDLLPILPHHCKKCARSLVNGACDLSVCGQCLSNETHFDQIFACYRYKPPIREFIVSLKFQHQLIYARALGHAIASHCQNQWYREAALPDVIIPVPLHPSRLRQRGFNQALEMAKIVSNSLKIPIDIRCLKRTRATPAQSQLSASQRASNVQGAFECQANYNDKFIAIIDDVITTGETVKAISKTLSMAGAKKIHIWAAARA